MNFSLRHAVAEDLPGIVSIYNSTVAGRMVTADTEPVTVDSRVAWFGAHDRERRPIWVVDDPSGGAVCAWLSFSSFYGRPAYAATVEVSIYVAPTHRRRGLGRFLLAEAVRQGPDFGTRTLVGFIFGHNEPSLRLFAGFGFEPWGRLPEVAELDGVRRDLVIVGRHVAP